MTPDTQTLHPRPAIMGGQRAPDDYDVIDAGNIVGLADRLSVFRLGSLSRQPLGLQPF